jgi:glycosyltransferase involved in cell wall biosynthesis
MGVAVARRPRRPLADADRPPAVAVLGGARDVHAYASMLGGVARALKQQPALQVFLELHGPHEHDIWRAAERLGLLGATSAIGPAAQHRSLLLRCDVILWPERFGELRSILLEAMAMALPVVAAADAPLDMLIDGQTARLVGAPFSDVAWEQSLASVLTDVTSAQAMGMRAREHVIANHRSTAHVEALMQTLAQVGGQDAYAFPRPSD